MAQSVKDKKKTDPLKKLGEKLLFKKKSAWHGIKKQEQDDISRLAERYKDFLNSSKTEREAISTIESWSKKHRFVDIKKAKKTNKRLFLKYNDVAGALVVANDMKSFGRGFLMSGSHIDSPRLDLKQMPLYESEDMAYMKTHYYGGVKKYQWVTRPLALHGTIVFENGSSRTICIGESGNDPVFTINDLLPHLAKNQNKKPIATAIEGEQLNILVGSIPYKFKSEKDAVKLAILDYLNRSHGITEQDFVSAELQVVPAGEARDVGFDRSFVGSYGQDDRVCAFCGLQALLDVVSKVKKRNLIVTFFDKEEIGSMGNSGANSNLVERIVNDVLQFYGKGDYNTLIQSLANSKFLSCDVNAGIDPEWREVNESMNAGKIGFGVCLTKYAGSRGKVGTNDAHAEFMAELRQAFNKDQVLWQSAELGKVDQGGGGTIAYFLAKFGMEVADCGPALLSMHAPFEISSKADVYHTYKAYKAFYKYL